jgi:hypothetical protein
MTVTVNAMVGGVSTSIRLLAGENPTRGWVGVVDGSPHYVQNIGNSTTNKLLQNLAAAVGDYISKMFIFVTDAAHAQVILKDGTTTSLGSTAVSAAAAGSLTVAGTPWGVDAFKYQIVEILSGPGAGQMRKINSNTNNTLTVDHAWNTTPTSASTFQIFAGIELLPYNAPVGVYGAAPCITARNPGGWRVTTDTGVTIPLATGSFS